MNKNIKEDEEYLEDEDGWFLIAILAFIFGSWNPTGDSKIKDLETRITKLEAKNEIIEKLITK